MDVVSQSLEDNTRPGLRSDGKGRRQSRRSIPNLIPWLGVGFWFLLWVWIFFSSPKTGDPSQGPPPTYEKAQIQLHGLNIRQRTDYTENKFTWMDLAASSSHNIEGSADSHLLKDVEVKVVVKSRKDPDTPSKKENLSDLSRDLDVAWFLIKADQGVYSFQTNNIELEGHAQVFGYTLDGTLTEWISADRIIYDSQNGEVRSDGYAVYQGEAIDAGRPLSGLFSAGLDLSEATIKDWRDLPPGYKTPFNDESMKPPYEPPEALMFLKEEEPSGKVGSLPTNPEIKKKVVRDMTSPG